MAGAAVLAAAPSPAQTLRRASDAVHTGSSEPRRRASDDDDGPRPATPSSAGSGAPRRWFRSRYFLPFPYAWGYAGYDAPGATTVDARPRSLAVIAGLDGGLALPDVGRGGASLRLLGAGFELELRFSAYAERDAGQTLWVGFGRYRAAAVIADDASLRLRLFAGMLHWIDDRGSEFGAEGGVGLDVFPGAPWVLSFEVAGGVLGRAGLVSLRGTLGYLVGPVELQLGWQHESLIPTVSGDTVDLSGPLAGVRLWR